MKTVIYVALALLIGGIIGASWALRQRSAQLATLSDGTPTAAMEASELGSGTPGRRTASDPAIGKDSPDSTRISAQSLANIFGEKRLSRRSQLLTAALAGLGSKELGELVRSLREMSLPAHQRKDLFGAVLAAWVDVDAVGAAQAFRDLPIADQVASVDAFGYAWASYDPNAALAWSSDQPHGQVRTSMIGYALTEMSRTDTPGALAKLQELDVATARWAGAGIYAAWVQRDPVAAAQSASAMVEDAQGGEWALMTVGTQWGRQDPEGALKWLREGGMSNSPLGLSMASTIVASASGLDPAGTTSDLWQQPTSSQTIALRSIALQSWMEQDPGSAGKWFNELAVSDRSQFLLNVSRTSYGSAAASWLGLAENLPPGTARSEAYRNLLTAWSATQPEHAMRYVSRLTDPQLASTVMPSLASGVANTQPDLALELAMGLPKSKGREQSLNTIAHTWVSKDPVQATASLTALPPSSDRNQLLSNAGTAWARTDPDAAIAWVQNLQNDTSRDAILTSIASTITPNQPERAITLAHEIGDIKARQKQVTNLARRWLKADPAAARTWIQQATALTEQQKSALLSHP